jgi:hypothetical protein
VAQHQLQRRLQSLRSRAVRLTLARGLSAMVACVLALAMVFGLVDYGIRFRDRGVLLIFTICVLVVLAWTVRRLFSRFHAASLGDTELALQVEALYPSLKDRLASAVEFLKQPENDACAGSAAMRRAAIAQAAAQCDEIDFGTVLNMRPAFRAALTSLAVCLLAAGLVLLKPAAARTALARLVLPLGSDVWPQKTHIHLKSSIGRIARGMPLEIEVVDTRGEPLPANCRVHYRLRDAGGKVSEENEAMRPFGAAMIARRENMTRPLEFRVTGGDDQSMPWIPVEVLDPPSVATLSVDVVPPGYTKWKRETRDANSSAPILTGSRVELSGEASKPLRSATLRIENGPSVPGSVEGDGRRFRFGTLSSELPSGLVLEKPCAYTVALEDRDGLHDEESWQFHVQADAAPTVNIERPKGDVIVTPKARINLRIDARDDLGLRQVSLVYSASGATISGSRSLALYEGPSQAAAVADLPGGVAGAGERRAIDYIWDLDALALQPHTQLTIYAAATDYCAQTGRSEARTLTITTPEEWQERLAARQGRILAELARLLQLQRDVRGRVRALELRLHQSGGLEQAEIDRLQAADFNQREVVLGLTDRSDGVSSQVSSILSDLETNLIDNPDFTRRLQGLLEELDRLQREHFPPIGDELTAAIKGSQSQSSARPSGHDVEGESHLARAGEHQQRVIESLEEVLSQLRQWDDYRRFQRDVSQLLRDQEEIARLTAELGRQTVGRDLKELLPQETADLTALAERQFELARRQNRIEQEMEQTIALLRPNEPLSADTLGDALAEARQLGIAAAMLTAGGKIRDNSLGQAPAAHQTILQNLQTVLDILSNNRAQEGQRFERELQDAARSVDGLRKKQEGLRRKLDELAAASEKGQLNERQKAELQGLLRQQEELHQETLRMARRLERLQAHDAAEAAKKAAEKMGDAVRGGSPKAATDDALEAEKQLAEVDRQLKAKVADHVVQQALEQQARLTDAIKHLHRQEQRIESETREFAALERTGPLSRAQVFGLLELARQQSLLRDDTDRLTQSLAPANTFRLGLSAASSEMRRAEASLQEKQTGPATQRAEQAAIARLALLVAALEPENKENSPGDNSGGGSGGPGKAGAPPSGQSSGITLLAEIKFLKLWQEDLNGRTQQLETDAARTPPDELRNKQSELAEEQARLAEAAFRLRNPQQTDANEQDAEPGAKKEN